MMIARKVLYAGKVLRTPFKSSKYIEKMQLNRLKYIVAHAYKTTELYHRKFKEAGIRPEDIQSLSDIKKIPLTTKSEMQRTEEAVSMGYSPKNSYSFTTSGSTGKKLRLLHNYAAFDFYMAVQFRYVYTVGMRPWFTYAFMQYDEEERAGFSLAKFSRAVPVPWYLNAEEKTSLLKGIQPDALGGHPCSILLVAKHVEREVPVSLNFILLGGELSTPEEREYIEGVFGCETFNKYGSYELGQIACECPEHSMHIDADNNIIEVLQDTEDAAPGEPGEVVGTNLWNTAMPFIRYRTGDIACLSDDICTCGRNFPLLQHLQGRRDDFISAGDKLIPPTNIVPIFFTFPEIDGFQVIQEDENTVRIRLVKGQHFTHETVKMLIQKLKDVLGPMTIHIEECENIQEEKVKLRAVISKVRKG
jgi:phenylacetate-CoA ligase